MSKQSRGGYGLVRRCRLEESPVTITVGDVTVTITRLGTLTATVGIKAPPDMEITFADGRPLHETVEQAIQSMVEPGADDNA